MKLRFCLLIIFYYGQAAYAQLSVPSSVELKAIPQPIQLTLFNALDSLLLHIEQGQIKPDEIEPVDTALNRSIFYSLKGIALYKPQSQQNYYQPQLLNIYAVEHDRYFIRLAFIAADSERSSIRVIFDFLAHYKTNQVTFAIPLRYVTTQWAKKKIGTVTYHYPDKINSARAKIFDNKNKLIALKLGIQAEQFDFYLCDNYQEILSLLGYAYDSEKAGKVNEGYGVDGNNIFSVRHNEDFSHDVFHYYSAKIRHKPRNSAAEEGIAYSWGNAYYTDINGETITQKQLADTLKEYIATHADANMLELFNKNQPIFSYDTKVKSLLSSLICDEVERRGGIPAIKELLDCGKGDENYFKAIAKLAGITSANFDAKVRQLLVNYR